MSGKLDSELNSTPAPPPSSNEFERLLEALAPDRELAGVRYEELRTRLCKFFSWRGRPDAEALADRTLDRMAKKLAEGVQIDHAGSYAHATAQFLLLEAAREDARLAAATPAGRSTPPILGPTDDETLLRRLDDCLARLDAVARDIIVSYYRGSTGDRVEARRALAERLGLPPGGLRNRALRIRKKLENCLKSGAAAGPVASNAGSVPMREG